MLRLSANSENPLGFAVAVCESSTIEMPSRPFTLRLDLVGVVHCLGNVEPAQVVPGHRDRLEDLGLGDEELCLEPSQQNEVLL